MRRTIEIVVSSRGEITIEAVNFKGPDCALATRFLEEALGQVISHRKKPEFYQVHQKTHHLRLGN